MSAQFNVAEPLYEPPIGITSHKTGFTLEVITCLFIQVFCCRQIVEHGISQIDDIIYTIPCTLDLPTVTLQVNKTGKLHTIGVFIGHVCPDITSTFEVENGVFTSIVFPTEIIVHLVDESFDTLLGGENVLRTFRRRIILVQVTRCKTQSGT